MYAETDLLPPTQAIPMPVPTNWAVPILSIASDTGSNPTNSQTLKPAPWTAKTEAAAQQAGSHRGNPARPRTASIRGRSARRVFTMMKALATDHVLAARARICTFRASPGRLGKMGISVGAARLDHCKR